jgi:hypothetical protein
MHQFHPSALATLSPWLLLPPVAVALLAQDHGVQRVWEGVNAWDAMPPAEEAWRKHSADGIPDRGVDEEIPDG